jgi:hypothetical protein
MDPVGDTEGERLGRNDGDEEGPTEGEAVGSMDSVGDTEGEKEGEYVGACVGAIHWSSKLLQTTMGPRHRPRLMTLTIPSQTNLFPATMLPQASFPSLTILVWNRSKTMGPASPDRLFQNLFCRSCVTEPGPV